MPIVKRAAVLSLAPVVLLSALSCRHKLVREATSPANDAVAQVYDAPDLDGPVHSLWVKRGEKKMKAADLAPDNESCTSIFWYRGGARVAFMIDGIGGMHAKVFDSAGNLLARVPVAADEMEVRDFAVTDTGALRFTECPPQTMNCTRRSMPLPR